MPAGEGRRCVKKGDETVKRGGENRGEDVHRSSEVQGPVKEYKRRKSKKEQEVETLKSEVEAKTKLADENYDRFLRAQAELENYKKRVEKEKNGLVKYGNEELIRALLPVIDNLERALDHPAGENPDGIIEGIKITINQFHQVLEKFGVTRIAAVGKPFDPSKHEAMMQVESSEHEPNTVVSELQKGYFLNDRLLRPAMVSVARSPEEPQEGEESSGSSG